MTSGSSDNGTEMRRVGEIMIPLNEYPHLPVWSSLREAVEMMHQAVVEGGGRTSLPRIILLFDLDGSIAGFVRRRDIMRGLEPRFMLSRPLEYRLKLFNVEADPNLAEMQFDNMVKGLRQRVDRPVADVMRPILRTINFDDHIMKAVSEMVSHGLSVLPVMRDNRAVGVVRTVDVFNELAELVL